MTRNKMREIIDAIKNLRSTATDEQAIEAAAIYPMWRPNTAYSRNDRLMHNGTMYAVLIDHTSQIDWIPSAAPSLYARVLIPDSDIIPEWVQPDSTNPYAKNDRVRHKGKVWDSDVNGNVWEPGVYGWTEVQDG